MENSETDQLFTIADISRQFNLPESTCRYYCKRFAEYIPTVGEGRRKRFRKDTFSVIETIVEEMKKSRTCDAVEDILAVRYPRTAIVLKDQNRDLAANSVNKEEEIQPSVNSVADLNSNNYPLGQLIPPLMLEYMDRQTKALEGIAKIFNVFANNFVNTYNNSNNSDDQNIIDMKQQIKEMKQLLNENEKNQQADLDQLRTWITRIMKKICSSENK